VKKQLKRSRASIEVPQTRQFADLHSVLVSVAAGDSTTEEMSARTHLARRQVNYALVTAREFGLLARDGAAHRVLALGHQLIAARTKHDAKAVLDCALRASAAVKAVAPDLLADEEPSQEDIADRIVKIAHLSPDTAHHRAGAFLSWRRQLREPQRSLVFSATPQGDAPLADGHRSARSSHQGEHGERVKDSGQHILDSLSLPDRYESLAELLGPEVIKVIVEPDPIARQAVETAATTIRTRGEGLFVPLAGGTGVGKTTFASTLTHYYPRDFAPTVLVSGAIDYEALNARLADACTRLPTNDSRIIPINIDHRESSPPTPQELASIKRFMRAPSLGRRSLILWPETSADTARQIGAQYQQVAGLSPIPLPLTLQGPPRPMWRDVTRNTLLLTNAVNDLEDIGVSPDDYDPESFPTLGEFLRQMSMDFNRTVLEMRAATRVPVSVAIVFVSESNDAGILSTFTNSTRLGLLDSHALVSATKDSRIGRWWTSRGGALTTTIFKLNARAFYLPPACTIAILRRNGADNIRRSLAKLAVVDRGERKVNEYLGRTDLGRFLLGTSRAAYEMRGKPPEEAREALIKLGKRGYTYGRDKIHNKALRAALRGFLNKEQPNSAMVHAEEKLDFAELIPDNWVDRKQNVVCLEYTWRNGDFLRKGNRSGAAQYILEKLKSYATSLGWVAD
jgi:hypothetical protein